MPEANFPQIQVPGEGQLYARLHTSLGNIVVKLEEQKAPDTVKNFVGLATGTQEWKDPASGQAKKGVPLYDGTIFHRVIPDFMIQAGCPLDGSFHSCVPVASPTKFFTVFGARVSSSSMTMLPRVVWRRA